MRIKSIALIALVATFALIPVEVRAEQATPREMERVCLNWLTYSVLERGSWAGSENPQITAVHDLEKDGLILAHVFSIAPNGYVVIPVLKELPAVKMYSEDCGLDVNEIGGIPQLLRDVLFDRLDRYIQTYGSLGASQPAEGEVLLGRQHRKNWDRFLMNRSAFHAFVTTGGMDQPVGKGPLLETLWHQHAPFNNFCPELPSGAKCVVGCVATAAAQIMKFHNWPPVGFKRHTYSWNGENLSADFSDPYDWDNMHEKGSDHVTQEEKDAVAELCYEVGVAFEMHYGPMSGASFNDAMDGLIEFFRFDPSITIEHRNDYTQQEWFTMIQDEINGDRPMMYGLCTSGGMPHAVVCDGWRIETTEYEYHMNYGWGGSNNGWYFVDRIHNWPMSDVFLKNIAPVYDSIYTVNPDGSGDYTEIQPAINDAAYGQGILVEPGTYDENIDFLGETIILWSTQGPGATIIDGGQAGSVVKFQNGEDNFTYLAGFTIQNGSATNGGGICGIYGSPNIINCDIHDNTAASDGGGIYWTGSGGSSPKVKDCVISDNSASKGGGIYIEFTSMPLINSRVFDNTASLEGGGIYWFGMGDMSPTLTNDTVYGNSAGQQGGGFYCSGSNPLITNTIFWSNTPEQIHVPTGFPSFTFCDIEGGWPGTGNINDNPLLTADLHLTADSPCVNGGNNDAPALPEKDFDGDPRIANLIVDMGADEFFGGLTIRVPADHPTIQEAIDYSENGDMVLVDPNTYWENIDYLGKSITVKSTAGPESTIIDGGQAESVVRIANQGLSDTRLEGFTITNGYSANGGGIHCSNVSATIANNLIHGNQAEQGMIAAGRGGGLYCEGSYAATIINNSIYGNEANYGGGIYLWGNSTPLVANNTVSGNWATGVPDSSGGGLSCSLVSPIVMNTILWDNDSATGPEIALLNNAALTINFSDVNGGQASVHIEPGSTLDWQDVMIDEDPLFVNAAGGDFHLTWLSPCVNRGTNDDAPAADIDGDDRPFMGTVEMGSDEYTGVHSMAADTFIISQATGGVVNFSLDAGASNGGRYYLVFGGYTGTVPGYVAPGGLVTVPVNWDEFTDIVMANLNTAMFRNFLAVLAPDGTGSATFDTLGPLGSSFEGLTLSFAFALNNPWNFASTPVNVLVVE